MFGLALVVAVRVFLFSAAFPLFNNVDEESHFDLVSKYAHGELPRKGLERYSPEASATIALYRSTEFLAPPRGGPLDLSRTPRWRRTDPEVRDEIENTRGRWQTRVNHETQSPPLYYAIAGAWFDLGKLFGIGGAWLVYWIRFLNVPICALTLILAHRFCARNLPSHSALRLGVPWLIAFLPQDVEYSINSDTLSAPLSLLAIHLLLAWISREKRSLGLALAVGATVAAACLTKSTNVVLVALVVGALLLVRWRPVQGWRPRDGIELTVAACAASLPVLLWSARTMILSGEPTGSADKIAMLGWTAKPMSRILDHPILSPSGAWTFLSELIRTSWRGEFTWHGSRLASGFADAFYVGSTVLLAAAGVIVLLRGAKRPEPGERTTEILSVASLMVSVLLLAALSMAFDFGSSFYPSKASPYFISGRLLSGSLVPFLIVYVAGLELWLPSRGRLFWTWTILAAAAAIQVGSEWILTAEVFRSPFNAYHLGL